MNKALIEEKERAEIAAHEVEVKAFCDKYSAMGVPPAILEKVKPLLLSRQSKVIRLTDDSKDDMPSLKFFGELFDALPKVAMRQISSREAPGIELSDVDKAKEHAKAIAESIK